MTTKLTLDALTIGQKLRINVPEWGENGGFSHGKLVTIIEIDNTPGDPWPVRCESDVGSTGILSLKEVELAGPIEPSAPQTKSVLDLLRKKGSITPVEAEHVLRCRSLPRRILDLKNLGHAIVTERKKDPTGQVYARYHLQAA